MKRVNIWTGSPQDGTSFYRAWGVFNQIARRENLPIFFDQTDKGGWEVFGKYDLIFMHRVHDKSHLDYIAAAQGMVPVWLDFDDDLINVPKTNPTYRSYAGSQTLQMLPMAQVITASTQGILDNYNTPGTVIKNFIPITGIRYNKPEKAARFRVMWRGSATHGMDWKDYRAPLMRFLKGKKDVEFVSVGAIPELVLADIQTLVDTRVIDGIPDAYRYMRFFESKQLADVCFVPLATNLFNRAKSDCAVKEALVNGAISITPSWNNNDLYFYNNPDQAEGALEQAYKKWRDKYSDFVEEVVFQQEQAKEDAEKNYTKRLDILKNILNLH